MLTLSAAFVCWTVASLELTTAALGSLWIWALLVFIIVISFVAGWFGSVLIGWVILGPILLAQSERNGGPFSIGDAVQIINGKHDGKVTTVYSKWQHEANRIELGQSAKENYMDIFADYQLLRINDDSLAQASDQSTA